MFLSKQTGRSFVVCWKEECVSSLTNFSWYFLALTCIEIDRKAFGLYRKRMFPDDKKDTSVLYVWLTRKFTNRIRLLEYKCAKANNIEKALIVKLVMKNKLYRHRKYSPFCLQKFSPHTNDISYGDTDTLHVCL